MFHCPVRFPAPSLTRRFPLLFCAASLPLTAADLAIAPSPFTISRAITATALPAKPKTIRINAEQWTDFELTALAAHGSRVAEGDVLMEFDRTDFDQKLSDAREAKAVRGLKTAQALQDLERLTTSTPQELEKLKRAAARATERNAYFVTTERAALEESADQSLKRTEQSLENQREELRQLTKMYEADDLTEETEEIILIRQKLAVESAEFSLRMQQLEHKRTKEIEIPERAIDLADAERDAKQALAAATADMPRALELKKIEIATMQTANAREDENLAKLELDEKRFRVTAPAAGWFYHGPIEFGRWTPTEAGKFLIVGSKVPALRPVASFIPADGDLELVAFLDESTARGIEVGATGSATLTGRGDLSMDIEISNLATTPDLTGTYRADFEAAWPEDLLIAPGSTARIDLVSFHADAAIAVPTKALTFGPQGWTVEVKLADGKTARRVVTRGVADGENTLITSGLEAGQVIIVP